MSKKLSGAAKCPLHGPFNWHGIYRENGEVVVGRLKDMSKNCGSISYYDGAYHVPAICPQCHRTYKCTVN